MEKIKIIFPPWINKWINKRFLSNVGLLGISNVIYSISQWGILILLTKLSSIDYVARFSLSLAIVSPVMLFLGAGLRVYIASDVNHRNTFEDYFFTRVISTVLGMLIIIAIGLINAFTLEPLVILILVGLTKVVEGIQEVCWGISQRSQNMQSVGVSRILRAITSVISVTIGLWIWGSLVIGLAIWFFTWVMILILYDFPATSKLEHFKFQFNPKISLAIIKGTIPLALIAGLIALNEKVTIYQISAYLGEMAVGFFAPLSYIVQGVSLAIKSINEAATPKQAVEFHSDRKQYKINSLLLAGFGGVVGLLTLIIFGAFRSYLLPLIYSADFLAYKDLFVVILAIGVLRYILAGFGTSVTAAGLLREQVPFWIISLATTFASGYFLIPRFGLYGAAYSVGAGILVNLVLIIILWQRTLRENT